MKIDMNWLKADAIRNFEILFEEAKKSLQRSWEDTEVEASKDETSPKYKLGFKITIDPTEGTASYEVNHGVRYKVRSDSMLPDPEQREMTFDVPPDGFN